MANIFEGKFGIEREAIRIDEMANVSHRSHPKGFKEHNPYVTKDFAEAQIEMITPPCESIDSAVDMLEDIQQVVLENLEQGDMLWKHSNPPVINKEIGIPVATFPSDPEKSEYREYLLNKYGVEKSIFSGVHFNFSFSNSLLNKLYLDYSNNESFIEFKNNLYLKVTRYLLKNRGLFIYLTNASPIFHNSFYEHCVNSSNQLNTGDCIIDGLTSLRNSNCGYRNKEDIFLDYSSFESYKSSIQKSIRTGNLRGPSELYTPVRLKEDRTGNIDYIEVRFIDINPYTLSGVSRIDLKYLHLHMIYSLFCEDEDFDKYEQVKSNEIHNLVTLNQTNSSMLNDMIENHKNIKKYFKDQVQFYNLEEIFNCIEKRLYNESETYSAKLILEYQKSSYIDYHLEQAIKQQYFSRSNIFNFSSGQNLELSTKILLKEAIKEGYIFEILDLESNFISLENPLNGQLEYIQQATKTNLDHYASVLAMENKIVTKKILKKKAINVPEGYELNKLEDLSLINLSPYENKGIVIKPNTTNFGEGITIFPKGASKDQITSAIDFAFSKDSSVLLEEFIHGKEYRFLVINGIVSGVIHRRAANVLGDGKSSITDLVDEKNKNPLRGTNYITPLEKIKLGEKELEFLTLQDLDFNSIPNENEVIYLRENSNISTGGDSVDLTDMVHPSYFVIAQKATEALGVNISGVDIIIEDIAQESSESNYSILELNFNPAIHIHTYPLEGQRRNPAKLILDSLFKIDREII